MEVEVEDETRDPSSKIGKKEQGLDRQPGWSSGVERKGGDERDDMMIQDALSDQTKVIEC